MFDQKVCYWLMTMPMKIEVTAIILILLNTKIYAYPSNTQQYYNYAFIEKGKAKITMSCSNTYVMTTKNRIGIIIILLSYNIGMFT